MPKAASVLAKAATRQKNTHQERRIGRKEGEVKTRTVIAGRSYDHVETGTAGEREVHPTNIRLKLGTIQETPAHTYTARHKDVDLGEHTNPHKAARAVVSHVRGGGFGVFGLGSDNEGDAAEDAGGAADSNDADGI